VTACDCGRHYFAITIKVKNVLNGKELVRTTLALLTFAVAGCTVRQFDNIDSL
jgi:hypothetical protein